MKLTAENERAYRLQQYGSDEKIEGVCRVPLRRFNDDGGSMTELLRLGGSKLDGSQPEALAGFETAQMNYSTLQPWTIKAFHIHRQQTDVWFVPPEDRLLLVLFDARAGVATAGNTMRWVLGDSCSELVRIPPGVAHGCRNIGEQAARIIYFTDRTFSPEPELCDEGRLPWDSIGDAVWEISRE